MNEEITLTQKEAYKAMYLFLLKWWDIGHREEEQIANILGGAALLADGDSADPALYGTDWRECVEKILEYRGKPETGDEPWAFRLIKK